jgi:FkbM family methyltransferase
MSEPRVFFQIGTNDGNDLFRQLVIANKPDIVILVKPNDQLIHTIKTNYAGINAHIYSNAIYYSDNETIDLYIPSKNGIYGQKADNGITYNNVHFSLVPMNDWGKKEDMVKITTKSITFDTICENHHIKNIEYLQIDTEGFDSDIIEMIDFNKYKINEIRFEKWGFDKSCFTAYNEKIANKLGQSGMNITKEKLIKHNYTLTDIIDRDGNDVLATLNE